MSCFTKPRKLPLIWAAVLVTACLPGLSGCNLTAGGNNLEGVRLYQQGQPQAALQSFQRALASDPKNADAYYNMAATMHQLGLKENKQELLTQAETLYNQCLDQDPNHVDCYRGLAVLLVDTNRSDKAFTLLKNWAANQPKVAEARVELARLYEEYNDKETAQLQLNQALQVDPNNHRAWTALGRLREEAGDYQQALANYQRSYSLNRLQPVLVDRIAALNRQLAAVPGSSPTPPGGARMVNTPPPPAANSRY